MAYQVIIHVANEEPILAEVEALPSPSDTLIIALNPRLRDGKDLRYLAPNVTMAIWPMSRVTVVEIVPSGEEEAVIGPVRE
jgi:hypothetical protein